MPSKRGRIRPAGLGTSIVPHGSRHAVQRERAAAGAAAAIAAFVRMHHAAEGARASSVCLPERGARARVCAFRDAN